MRGLVEVRTGLAGFLKVEALEPNAEGELVPVWEWESPNLITEEGLARLHDTALRDCMPYAAMGTRTTAPTSGDKALDLDASAGEPGDGLSYYALTYPPELAAWCLNSATPDQPVRTLRATSNTALPSDSEVALVADTYWRRRFVRSITYTHACFPYSIEHFDALTLSQVGTDRMYPLMSDEAAFLQEVSFVESADILRVEPISCAPSDPVPNKEFYDHVCSPIWNRVVLPQSLGFFGEGTSGADVVLSNEGEIRITYELRLYPPVAPIESVIDVNGVSTTVQTRAYRLDDAARWSQAGGNHGMILEFGSWAFGSGESSPARVGDSNAMPALNANAAGSEVHVANRSFLAVGPFHKDLRYTVGTGEGNFAGGIGHLTTGRFRTQNSQGQTLIHTFTPKVAKSTTERFLFDVRYSWGVYTP